jgi:Group II intron, maturase-specific domain
MHNPCIRGWITYYSHFYKTQLRPTLKRIDAYVIRWARRSSNDCATRPKAREIGLTGYAVPIQPSLHIGRYVMAPAEHREPCDSRGSRTVLGAPGGEIPPGDSTNLPVPAMSAGRSAIGADGR